MPAPDLASLRPQRASHRWNCDRTPSGSEPAAMSASLSTDSRHDSAFELRALNMALGQTKPVRHRALQIWRRTTGRPLSLGFTFAGDDLGSFFVACTCWMSAICLAGTTLSSYELRLSSGRRRHEAKWSWPGNVRPIHSPLAMISAILDSMGRPGPPDDPAEIQRMQDGVRAAVLRAARGSGRGLREVSPRVLLSLLCAGAFSPFLTGPAAVAGIGVLSALGAHVAGGWGCERADFAR